MPTITIPYTPRSQFLPLHRRIQRWAIVVAHRRAGKTVACVNELIRGAASSGKREPRFAYVAPYFSQAKDVAWSYLKQYTQPIPGIAVNESELRVDLPNGGRVRLYGADNYDRLRGIYLDGVVLDEYGDMEPRAWSEALRPSLADRQGWAVFIGTPRGLNHFADQWDKAQSDPEWFSLTLKASQTGLLPPEELRQARQEMSEEQYLAEFECSFAASVVGSYFGREMQEAENDGRITRVPYQKEVAVDTWWDLGVRDASAIWFTQTVGREIHIIDYYEASGEGLPHYAKVLQERSYVYGIHNAPHDIRVRELGSGRSRIETAESLGIRFKIVSDISREDGIEAARSFISRCWFDREKTERGRLALTSYRKVWDEKRRVFQAQPYHDWASNGCFLGSTEVLTPYGMRRIMDLPETGRVLTSCGWKRYENPRVTKRDAPLVEVAFVGGYTVRCTPDHLFMTESGWISASNLRTGMPILSTLTRSRSISMAVSIACGRVSGIYRRVAQPCIVKCGKLLSAIYQEVATSTIVTGTYSTTSSIISNASPLPNTLEFHETGVYTVWGPGHLDMHWKEPLNGTDLRKAGCGIGDMPSAPRDGRSGGESRRIAPSAELSSWRSLARAVIHRCIVQPRARFVRISSVRRLSETADVWDITVPGERCFSLANGAVVHNSDAFRYLAVGHRFAVPKPTPRSETVVLTQNPSSRWMAG